MKEKIINASVDLVTPFYNEEENVSEVHKRHKKLEEIFNIPQIIGGYSQNCLEKAELFWQNITSTTVSTSNLEAAEMTKLLNNSYRDLTFGFSNAFIEVATRCNLEANKVIKAAN